MSRRRTMSEERKNFLLQLFNHECLYCGTGNELTVEHLLPLSCGGSNDLPNLAIACGPCNWRRLNKPLDVFIAEHTNAEEIKAKLLYVSVLLAHQYNRARFLKFDKKRRGLREKMLRSRQKRWRGREIPPGLLVV